MSHRLRHPARAFTLIEVVAVLLLTAVLAALVGASMTGQARAARLEDAVSALASFDQLTRRQARQLNRPMRMEIDLDTQRVRRVEAASTEDRNDVEHPGPSWPVPAGLRIGRVFLFGETAADGQVAITCSTLGHTPTYALEVTRIVDGEAPDPQPHEQRLQTWLIVTGLTGQFKQVTDENELRQIMAAIGPAAGGHVAD